MWNGLRYWQPTAQLAKWGQATENLVQPMGCSVLAIVLAKVLLFFPTAYTHFKNSVTFFQNSTHNSQNCTH